MHILRRVTFKKSESPRPTYLSAQSPCPALTVRSLARVLASYIKGRQTSQQKLVWSQKQAHKQKTQDLGVHT